MNWRSLRARLERLEHRRGPDLDQKCPECGQSPYKIRFHEFGEWEDGEKPTCRQMARGVGVRITTVCVVSHGESCRICDEEAKLESEAREED